MEKTNKIFSYGEIFIFKNLKFPKDENVDQLQLYLHFFKIKKGILLYVNKDNQELKEFAIDYNPSRAKALLESLSKLKEQIDSNIIPSRLPEWPDNWQCQYCQFKEVCQMTGPKEVDWNTFKKKIESNNNQKVITN